MLQQETRQLRLAATDTALLVTRRVLTGQGIVGWLQVRADILTLQGALLVIEGWDILYIASHRAEGVSGTVKSRSIIPGAEGVTFADPGDVTPFKTLSGIGVTFAFPGDTVPYRTVEGLPVYFSDAGDPTPLHVGGRSGMAYRIESQGSLVSVCVAVAASLPHQIRLVMTSWEF